LICFDFGAGGKIIEPKPARNFTADATDKHRWGAPPKHFASNPRHPWKKSEVHGIHRHRPDFLGFASKISAD
jgi:hypothetical protein